MSAADCSMCGGGGVLYDQAEPRSCECRVRMRVRHYLRRHPQLHGCTPSRDLLIHKDGRLSPRLGNLIISGAWSRTTAALAGWMSVHARCGVYPRIWITSDDDVRTIYLSDEDDSVVERVRAHDLLVVRTLLTSSNKATASGLVEVLSSAITAPTPVPFWICTPSGRELDEHPAFRRDPDSARAMESLLDEADIEAVTL